jgi:hypothetical protein
MDFSHCSASVYRPVAIPGFLQKWLWMRQLDYAGIFWTLFSVKVTLTGAGFIFALLFLWLNVRHAAKSSVAWSTLNPAKAEVPPGNASSQTESHRFARHVVTRGTALVIGRCRRDIRERPLYAVGHLPALSLRWRLRTCRP